jgi:hypothetical protein
MWASIQELEGGVGSLSTQRNFNFQPYPQADRVDGQGNTHYAVTEASEAAAWYASQLQVLGEAIQVALHGRTVTTS